MFLKIEANIGRYMLNLKVFKDLRYLGQKSNYVINLLNYSELLFS